MNFCCAIPSLYYLPSHSLKHSISDGGQGYFSVTDYLWSYLDMQYASDVCHQRVTHGYTDASPVSQHVVVNSLGLHATVV